MTEMAAVMKSAFAGLLGADGSETKTIDTTSISEIKDRERALVSPLKGCRPAVEATLADLTGWAAPAPLLTASDKGWTVLWTEPHQWMVQRDAADGDIVAELIDKMGTNAAVFGVTYGRVSLEISGPNVSWVLSKHAGLDFDESVFQVGMVQSTQIAHVNVLLHRTAVDRFEITAMRSFARHLTEALLEACHIE